MPDLSSSIHLDMLHAHHKRRPLPLRLVRALRDELRAPALYGLEWGDVESVAPLKWVKERWVLPYVSAEKVGLEIGPGGGRWTRYLVGMSKLYVVDYYDELLAELRKSINLPSMVFIKNNGTDFPGVPDASIDFLFSFGVFVHLERDLIDAYLHSMRRVLRPGCNVVLHYSDSNKVMSRENAGFSDNDPERMRAMIREAGYRILEEDTTTMWHSSLVRFTL